MNVSRRSFIKTTLAAGSAGSLTRAFWFEVPGFAQGGVECTLPDAGPGTRFIPSETTVIERVPARVLGDAAHAADLARFRAAVKAVIDRPETDVIGWKKQVALHCIQCAPSLPTNIHYNWQFLAWHRALLYFHERILRATAAAHANIRVPYWDWESSMSRGVPAIYAQPNQSLHWNSRGSMGSGAQLQDNEVDVQPLLALPDFPIFGGTAVRAQPVPATYTGPHADVHNKFAPGDMSNLQYSPRDPLFYAHHCNLDRLWTSWIAAGHSNPDFGDARVFFYDENRQWRFVMQNDLRDEAKLGYRYAELMRPVMPPNALVTFNVRTPEWAMSGPDFQGVRQRTNPAFLLIQNIRNLERLPMDARNFGVFAGQPSPGVPTSDQPLFIGRFSRVLGEDHQHVDGLSTSLNVTGTINRLFAGDALRPLSLVVLDPEGRATPAGIPLNAERVSIIR